MKIRCDFREGLLDDPTGESALHLAVVALAHFDF